MSRIGKAPIPVPSGVTISITDGQVAVKGPKGELAREIPGAITIRQDGKVFNLKINASSQVENAPAELSDMCRVIAQIHSKHSYLLTAVEE